ncbi:ATP-binding cassette sub- A member 17 [Bulinus truncatus]|nr:ATP-binding cassette sub- A member 17 [Bulinus truncatus]
MLDEPTAGIDPIARRKLWDVLRLIRTSGRTLVLTSHSMEECEALCTRIAIMVHGYVLCLGSSQHLKSKYGKGYTVILHAAKGADGRVAPLSEAEKYVLETLGDSKIFAKQEAYTDIQIPENIPLSFIFEVLEKARGQFKFQFYTVQQTSLEQVFLRLLKVEESTNEWVGQSEYFSSALVEQPKHLSSSLVEQPKHLSSSLVEQPKHLSSSLVEQPKHLSSSLVEQPKHLSSSLVEQPKHLSSSLVEQPKHLSSSLVEQPKHLP